MCIRDRQKAPDRHPSPFQKVSVRPVRLTGTMGWLPTWLDLMPSIPSSSFKWVWAVSILLNAFFWARTDKRTNERAWMGPNPPQVNAKCDIVMKLSVFGTRTHTHTHTHTSQNLYILALRAVIINHEWRVCVCVCVIQRLRVVSASTVEWRQHLYGDVMVPDIICVTRVDSTSRWTDITDRLSNPRENRSV